MNQSKKSQPSLTCEKMDPKDELKKNDLAEKTMQNDGIAGQDADLDIEDT